MNLNKKPVKKTLFQSIVDNITRQGLGGYKALLGGDRKELPRDISAQDVILRQWQRNRLTGGVADLKRNMPLVQFIINRHLDYITKFSFQCRTEDEQFNRSVQKLMKWYSNPSNCDYSGRFSFQKLIRIAEHNRLISGDVLIVMTKSGHLQVIEGDRIANPTDKQLQGNWVNGCRIDNFGGIDKYCICNRGQYAGQRNFAAYVNAQDAYFLQYNDTGSIRGQSPLVSAITSLQDINQCQDNLLAKVKMASVMVLKVLRKSNQNLNAKLNKGATPTQQKKYDNISLADGPFVLDGGVDDDFQFMQSNQPANSTQDYLKIMMIQVMKTIDLPYFMLDEAHTNYYGAKASINQYQKACQSKIADITYMLDKVTSFILNKWVDDGILKLPKGVDSVSQVSWEWVPFGTIPLDPVKDSVGIANLISMGLTTYQQEAKNLGGGDWYSNMDENAKAVAYAKEKGLDLNMLGKINIANAQTQANNQNQTQSPDQTQNPDNTQGN